MKTYLSRALLIAAVLIALLPTKAVLASEVLYDSAGFIQGQQSFVEAFAITTSGTLTVTLSNITWPEKLASLGIVLSTADGLLTPQAGAGTFSIAVDAGNVYAQWFGQAQGPLGLGVYAIKVEFTPDVAPVPLPASAILLLSGFALLAWQRRQQRSPRADEWPAAWPAA